MREKAQQIVFINLEPEGKYFALPRAKTARQLLAALNLLEETALVARKGKLLTPDCHIEAGENILVRKAGSRG